MGDAAMPNAVYERTRSALTGLLPRRAATAVLDRALQRHRRSPDEVDGEAMAYVLLSGVYRELRGLVPDRGLRRTLRRLARDARGPSPAGRGATPSEVRAATRAPRPAGSHDPAATPDAPASPAPDERVAAAVPAAGDPVPAPIAASPAGASPNAVNSPAAGMSPAAIAAVAATLAALDGVHGVGLFDAAGRPLEVRGALPDAPALGRMVVAGAALLETGDRLLSVAVDTPRGRLVAVPVRPCWLALTGAADLNLGAVYAALAALEEER